VITLTREQTEQTCANEAKYQLTIMIQYLKEEEVRFYLRILHRYTNLLDFEYFCQQHKITHL